MPARWRGLAPYFSCGWWKRLYGNVRYDQIGNIYNSTESCYRGTFKSYEKLNEINGPGVPYSNPTLSAKM